MKLTNKVVSMSLSLVLLASTMSPTFAADSNATQTSPVKLTVQPIVFNVTVPSGLPVDVDSKGEVTVATNVKIENHSAAPITITGVQVNPIPGWNIVPMNKDFKGSKIGTKEFGFVLNDDEVPSSGAMTLTQANWPSINGGSNLPLSYDSVVAPQKDAIEGSKIADVVFTIGWDSAEISTEPTIKYVLATDEDFSGETNGNFKYIGNDEYVEIPSIIKNIPITSYELMFYESSVKGVKSTNTNITDTNGMFWSSKAKTLNVSELNTSNVTNMNRMFVDSQAITLDLISFDTSNVTNMAGMFENSSALEIKGLSNFETSKVTNMFGMFRDSQATSLDLSNFDISNVTDMSNMFTGSKAIIGYAHTQDDADKFNASSEKPLSLTFVLKP